MFCVVMDLFFLLCAVQPSRLYCNTHNCTVIYFTVQLVRGAILLVWEKLICWFCFENNREVSYNYVQNILRIIQATTMLTLFCMCNFKFWCWKNSAAIEKLFNLKAYKHAFVLASENFKQSFIFWQTIKQPF